MSNNTCYALILETEETWIHNAAHPDILLYGGKYHTIIRTSREASDLEEMFIDTREGTREKFVWVIERIMDAKEGEVQWKLQRKVLR